MKRKPLCYAARLAGAPGFFAVRVGDGDPRETAKDVAAWIRQGGDVVRVNAERAIAGMRAYIEWRRTHPHKSPRRLSTPTAKPAKGGKGACTPLQASPVHRRRTPQCCDS